MLRGEAAADFSARLCIGQGLARSVGETASDSVERGRKERGDGAQVGPRNPSWRADAAATLAWTEALDGGDPTKQAAKRDRVLSLAAPFAGEPATVLETEWRARGITWARADLALATESHSRQRKTRTWAIDPSGKVAPRLLWERSTEDRYGDPGQFVTRRDAEHGIAYLRTSTTTEATAGKPITWKPVSIATDKPVLGATAVALSGKTVARIASGLVTALLQADSGTVIDTNVAESSIMPGSPLVDTNGNLIGVSTGVSRASSGQGFIAAAELLPSQKKPAQ